jgi:hypothetical protein
MSSIWYLTNAPVDGIYSTPSNGAYLEFNRDQFLCNQITGYPVNQNIEIPKGLDSKICANIHTNTICDISNDFLSVKQCEICKNFRYREWYDRNTSATQAFSDSREEYLRSWFQSWNLGIGIILVLYGIYYQQS